ncbi:substrate-binding periplasmic protein [Parazoarcus communis]|nr:ABC transporter substrate-binding protein [Parazoarcus communis]
MTSPLSLQFARWLLVLFGAAMIQGVAFDAHGHQSRLDRILDEKRVRICIWPEYFGVTYRDPATRELRGIDIDLALELGRELNVGVEFVDSSFPRLAKDLLSDNCDVAMFGVGITAERAEKLQFTAPYLASDIYAVAARSSGRVKRWDDIDQPGIVVAVAKGTIHEQVMVDKLRHARLAILGSPHAREEEVASGRADVFMTDYPFSQRMLDRSDWARLISPGTPYHITPYAWAVAPGDATWFKRLETYLQAIKQDGRLVRAARRHGLEPIVITR